MNRFILGASVVLLSTIATPKAQAETLSDPVLPSLPDPATPEAATPEYVWTAPDATPTPGAPDLMEPTPGSIKSEVTRVAPEATTPLPSAPGSYSGSMQRTQQSSESAPTTSAPEANSSRPGWSWDGPVVPLRPMPDRSDRTQQWTQQAPATQTAPTTQWTQQAPGATAETTPATRSQWTQQAPATQTAPDAQWTQQAPGAASETMPNNNPQWTQQAPGAAPGWSSESAPAPTAETAPAVVPVVPAVTAASGPSARTLTPSPLANIAVLAERGYLENQGIPGGTALISALESGRVRAADVVRAAVEARRVAPEVTNDPFYERAIANQLRNLSDNSSQG